MARGRYAYEVTVRPLEADAAPAPLALTFQHLNHDDILAIVERVKRTSGLDADSAASLAVGLKLLSEVMLQERRNPIFEPLRAPMHEFIGGLKRLATPGEQPS